MRKRNTTAWCAARGGPHVWLLTSALVIASSCGHLAGDCDYLQSCPPGDAAGGVATSGGRGGGAGLMGNAGGGQGGIGGGESGAAGVGGGPPCEGACDSATPVCDESTNQCVECLARTDCNGSTPACDTATSTCVACTAKTDCKGTTPVCDTSTNTCVACTTKTDCKGTTPLCDTATNTCVACLKQSDCTDPATSQCDTASHTCKPCATDAHCADIADQGVCSSDACVQCTATKSAACGVDAGSGAPFVCDSLKHSCTTEKAHAAGLCQPCVSDSQCQLGELCVLDKLGAGSAAKEVGYFCHWKKGDTTHGAPADCPTQGRPYVQIAAGATSIDGVTADICALAVSSCVANNEFRAKNCAPTGTPDDTQCGVSAPDDAKCVAFGAGSRCTMTCLSDDDCPSPSTCDTSVIPRVCAL